MYLGSTAIGKAYLGENLVYDSAGGDVPTPILPSGYKQLGYVDNATTYISTGIMSVGTTWEVDIQMASNPSSTQIIICSDDYGGHWLGAISSGYYALGNSINFSQSVTVRSLIEITFVSTKVINATCNGMTISRTGTRDSSKQVLLFNDDIAKSYQFKGKVYSVKCTSGGSFEGIPAQRTSDSKKGLYDIANDVFYPLT